MKYEIPREVFKQRLEERLNFILVDLLADKSPVKYENVVAMAYGPKFKEDFLGQFPNKNQNIIVYSLRKGDDLPELAANELAEQGYNYVYYYRGTPEDVVLDKGLN